MSVPRGAGFRLEPAGPAVFMLLGNSSISAVVLAGAASCCMVHWYNPCWLANLIFRSNCPTMPLPPATAGSIQILREVRLLRFLRDSWLEADHVGGAAHSNTDATGSEDGAIAAHDEASLPPPPPHHPNIIQMLDCFFAPCLEDPTKFIDLYIVSPC
jgi:hypothetical protein